MGDTGGRTNIYEVSFPPTATHIPPCTLTIHPEADAVVPISQMGKQPRGSQTKINLLVAEPGVLLHLVDSLGHITCCWCDWRVTRSSEASKCPHFFFLKKRKHLNPEETV